MNILRRILGIEDDASLPGESSRTPDTEAEDEPLVSPIEIPGVGSMPAPEAESEPGKEGENFGVTRQLPPLESALTRPNQHLMFGQRTDVGMVRATNQELDPDPGCQPGQHRERGGLWPLHRR